MSQTNPEVASRKKSPKSNFEVCYDRNLQRQIRCLFREYALSRVHWCLLLTPLVQGIITSLLVQIESANVYTNQTGFTIRVGTDFL